MKLMHYLIELPLLILAVWSIYNATSVDDGIVFTLWPYDSEIKANTKLILFVFLLFGFVWSKINSWFGYAPMRRDIKQQKKLNKSLQKEQERLTQTVSGLQQNIQGLQEKNKALSESGTSAQMPSKLSSKLAKMGSFVKEKFAAKKGM